MSTSYKPKEILELITDATNKADLALSTKGLKELVVEINGCRELSQVQLGEKNLSTAYKRVTQAIQDGDDLIKFNADHINRIAEYLGFKDSNQYLQHKVDNRKSEDARSGQAPKNVQTSYHAKNITKFDGDAQNFTINNH